MNKNSILTLTLKPRLGKRAKSGHPWIFSNEITHPVPQPQPGILVEVKDDGGFFVGYGSYNPHSLIAIRLLSRNPDIIPGDTAWFAQKIQTAWDLRKKIYPSRNSYRLLYADSDGLSGVIIDKYEEYLTVQIHSAGMENLLPSLLEALVETMHPKGIILKNHHDKRKLENLPLYTKTAHGAVPERIDFFENKIAMTADIQAGQKTGHFFDQAENRLALAPYAENAEILDLFCHTGGWALSLLQAGAQSGIAIDSSAAAIEMAQENAQRNRFAGKMECLCTDAFDWVSNARREKKKFDVVVVDPPAFAKNAKQIKQALRGYEDINRQGIHLTKEGGIICSCSCSYFITEEMFLNSLQNAAAREHQFIQVLEIRGQAKDHPIHLSMPETRYLKCIIGLVHSEC